MASDLGKKGIAFRVVGAELTSLEDLRRQPVILIGAIDNKWTLRLTQNLRYRIEVANPPGSGSAKEPIASIIDSQNPGKPCLGHRSFGPLHAVEERLRHPGPNGRSNNWGPGVD